MTRDPLADTVNLDVTEPVWDHFFLVHNLVVIGSRQAGGDHDLAPKHMAIPLGWQNYFGFVCTPQHRTYLNVKQEREFTVSFPRPSQVVEASLTAAPRCEDDSKPMLESLPTFHAKTVDALFLQDAYLYLECRLHRIIDGFGDNSLIAGQITGAWIHRDAMRARERDDADLLHASPLLAYVSPGRFAHVDDTRAFPFPEHYKR
jgi:flavin reductase (DIM6/NTAB) family NADH-FMN oxidoreductase RutF